MAMTAKLWRPLAKHSTKAQITTPYRADNRSWFKNTIGSRCKIEYAGRGVWEVSSRHTRMVAISAVERFGSLEFTWDVSETAECTGSCQSADYHTWVECVCCCGGRFHGNPEGYDWFNPVGDYLTGTNVRRYTTLITAANCAAYFGSDN